MPRVVQIAIQVAFSSQLENKEKARAKNVEKGRGVCYNMDKQ